MTESDLHSLIAAVLPTTTTVAASVTSPRGIKRSRSPEPYLDLPLTGEGGDGDGDDQKPRKRGRPPKPKQTGTIAQNPHTALQQSSQAVPPQVQTPQLQSQSLPQQPNITPNQSSPPKPTPTKTVVKALPTVRDHTTDQLGPEGDEYVPREYDDAGEKKVNGTGHPLEGREYRCRTFFVPNRGDKLFMLATECARVLGYRDSYLLFNKNRSLYKIIATQAEKDDLIHQEILPYSYRSRQIAIVTAKSMFRQFGSRVIVDGRRVRDDYWESKARKQGFTEEDLAGEKRPGAAKARDAAAAAEAANAGSALGHHPEIVYSNGPAHIEGHPQPQTLQPGMGGPTPASLAPLPMIHLAPTDDLRLRDYGNVPRPRQEISGPPYQDRTQPSTGTEILNQASHAADFNRVLGQQRNHRGKYLHDWWKQPRDVPVSASQQQNTAQADQGPIVSQTLQSPQLASSGLMASLQQPVVQHQQPGAPPIMSSQHYPQQQQHQQNPMAQSPIRNVPQSIRSDQMHPRSAGLTLGSAGPGQGSLYGYSQPNNMWPPPQPQQSPISTHHAMPQYSPHAAHHSPHPQQPSNHPPPQLHHQQSGGSLTGSQMGFQGMSGMPQGGYAGTSRGLFNPSQSPQHYMNQTSAGQQPGMQGWAPPGPSQHGHQGWQGY
ncbi:MAG: hypothetical protein M1835_003927 [Candelina submexicana]|nr:MAG: hypothetical protein M1835_003927 [Candelina submexicana]